MNERTINNAINSRLEEISNTNTQLIKYWIKVKEELKTFLKVSQELSEEMNKLDRNMADDENICDMSMLEESRILIQQLYLQVCNIGKNLRDYISNKQTDNKYEDKVTSIIETHLETFTMRQTVVIEKWNKIETIYREQKQGEENIEKTNRMQIRSYS